VAAVQQNRPLALILDDALAAHLNIPAGDWLPDGPGDGAGDDPGPTSEVGPRPRSDDRKPEAPGCGPETS
jgi:hypothetical protein